MSNEILNAINTTTSILDRYSRVNELIKELNAEKAKLKSNIINQMTDGRLIDGDHVAVLKQSTRLGLDTKRIMTDFPEMKEVYGKETIVNTLTVK